MKEQVSIAQTFGLKNENTNAEISCAVVNVQRQANGLQEVGVDFRRDDQNFWRVNFPPADWTSRSPEANRFDQDPETTGAINTTVKRYGCETPPFLSSGVPPKKYSRNKSAEDSSLHRWCRYTL